MVDPYMGVDFATFVKALSSMITALGKNLPALASFLNNRDRKSERVLEKLANLVMLLARLAHYNIPLLKLELENFFGPAGRWEVRSIEEDSVDPRWSRVIYAIHSMNYQISDVVEFLEINVGDLVSSGLVLTDAYLILCTVETSDAPLEDRWAAIGMLDRGPGDSIDKIKEATAMLSPLKVELDAAATALKKFIEAKRGERKSGPAPKRRSRKGEGPGNEKQRGE